MTAVRDPDKQDYMEYEDGDSTMSLMHESQKFNSGNLIHGFGIHLIWLETINYSID